MRDNLACKNKYLCPFLSFSPQTCVVYRLHYSGKKGRPLFKKHTLIFSIQHKQKSLYRVNIHLCRYQLLRDKLII